MIRRNDDGSFTVGIIKEGEKGVVDTAPSPEKKSTAKTPRKTKKTAEN